MEKNEFRAVIKHLHLNLKDLTSKEIKAELDNVHNICTYFVTVYNWMNEFKCGRISIFGTSKLRLLEIDTVHDIVLTDRRVKVRELVEATGISYGTVISILHEHWV